MPFTFIFISCKKNHLASKYANLIQHKWDFKSSTKRTIVLGSYVGEWYNTQLPSGVYHEFTSDGKWISSVISATPFIYKADYQFLNDTTIIRLNPATINIPYSNPDTLFIRSVSESLLVEYYRSFYLSPGYSTLEETLDSLRR